MNKQEFDKKYVGKKIVVNCKTRVYAEKFLKQADIFGYSWGANETYTEKTHWDDYGEETCYWLHDASYCDRNYFAIDQNSFTIVTYSGKGIEMKKQTTKSNKPYVNGENFDIGDIGIKDIRFIKSAGVTIVEFTDGSKRKVRAQGGDEFDIKSGIEFCIAKKTVEEAGWSGNQFDKMVDWYADKEERERKEKEKQEQKRIKTNIKVRRNRAKKDKKLEHKIKVIVRGMRKAGVTVSLNKVVQAIEDKF